MPDEPIFAPARIKVARAKTFIQELHRILLEHVANDPIETAPSLEGDDPTGLIMSIRPIGLLPGAIVGDCVHNLRSALDLMSSELARLNAKNDKNVHFPVAQTKEGLLEQIQKKNFNKCGPDAVALLKTIAPYPGGNDRLRALHDLDLRDKHAALIPHGSLAQVKGQAYTDDQGVVRLRIEMGPEGMHFFFPVGTPFERRPLISTLHELVEMVEGILRAFEALVGSRAR